MRPPLALLIIVFAASALARTRPVRPGFADTPAPWLHAHASAIATAEPSADDSDLQPLLPLVAGARVIALGDVTHGTHELYALKQRLIPLLVERANVRTIVVEAPYAEWERIGDVVRSGGDPAPLLKSNDYWFWDTEEMATLLRWVAAWNEDPSHERVDVAGVDAYHVHATIGSILDRVGAADPALAAEATRRYDCLTQYAQNPTAYATYTARASCRASVLSVMPLLAARFPDDTQLLHAARVAEQGEDVLATNLASRDDALAENISWLLARKPDANIVVWGHNEHFGKTPYVLNRPEPTRSAGTILSEELGPSYVAIGSVAGRGTFQAVEFVGLTFFIHPFPMPEPSADDYATFLGAAGTPLMLVPLRAPLPWWLAAEHRLRFAGSNVPAPNRSMVEETVDLARKFDAVVYVETSTPTWR